jgi:hypothetical protein
VSIDIREDDEINAVVLQNGGGSGNAEVSFASSASFTSNDTSGTIIGVPTGLDISVGSLAIPVSAGERVFLHNDNAPAAPVVAFLYTKGSSTPRPSPRRR